MSDLLSLLEAAARESIPVCPRVRVGIEGDGPGHENDTWWCVVTGYSAATTRDEPVVRAHHALTREAAIRNAALAFVCGDSVVWKPSEKTPLTGLAVQAALERLRHCAHATVRR